MRVAEPGAGPRAGTLVALTPDSLVAHWAQGDTAAIPLAGLTRLDVSEGPRSRWRRGAVIGLLAGAAAGAAYGAAAYREPDCSQAWVCFDYGPGTTATIGALAGGAAGGIVGALIGAGVRTEAWRRVPLGPGRVGLAVPASRRGAGLGVALSF